MNWLDRYDEITEKHEKYPVDQAIGIDYTSMSMQLGPRMSTALRLLVETGKDTWHIKKWAQSNLDALNKEQIIASVIRMCDDALVAVLANEDVAALLKEKS